MTREDYEKNAKKAASLSASRTDGGYTVKSSTGKGGYLVTEEDNSKLVCSCPDYYMHGGKGKDPDWKCKHVIAVETYLKTLEKVSTTSRFAALDI